MQRSQNPQYRPKNYNNYKPKNKYRKTSRAKPTIPRNRSVANSVYFFKRHVRLAAVTLSNAAITTGGFSFQLDEVPNYAEFTALFDQYKIAAVAVTCYFNSNNIQVQSAVPFNACRWISVIDYNSSGTFAGLDDAREFQTAEIGAYPDWKAKHTRYIKPRIRTVVEDNSASLVAGGNRTGWIDTTVANIPHYGYRYIFEQLTSPYTGNVEFEAVYYMQFKQVK